MTDLEKLARDAWFIARTDADADYTVFLAALQRAVAEKESQFQEVCTVYDDCRAQLAAAKELLESVRHFLIAGSSSKQKIDAFLKDK